MNGYSPNYIKKKTLTQKSSQSWMKLYIFVCKKKREIRLTGRCHHNNETNNPAKSVRRG